MHTNARSWSRTAWSVVAAWVAAGSLRTPFVERAEAQPTDQRAALEQFRDSIALADSGGLRRLESNLMMAAKRSRRDATLHIKLGFVAIRLGDFGDAASEFNYATRIQSQWPYAWLGWALAELRLGDQVASAKSAREVLLTRDAWTRAAQAVARAASLDTTFATIALAEQAAALAAGRADWARVIRDGLRRAAANRGPGVATLLLAVGRADRAVGDTAAATQSFAAAAERPETRALGQLELARTQLTAGDPAGIPAYFAAAARDDRTTVPQLRAELALVASGEELARFDSAAGEERAAALWEFWTRRDRRELRGTGERLLEHYRRLAAARASFPSFSDPRARVLLRHGEPDARAGLRGPGVPANESWRYQRSEGDLVVHFVARGDSTDYALVESVLDIATPVAPQNSAAGAEQWQADLVDRDQLLRSRAQLSPFYQALASGRRIHLAELRERERALGREGARLALTTDRFPIRFARDLAARIQVLGFGSDPAGPGIHILFAIPGFAVEPVGEEGGGAGGAARYPVRVRFVAWDSADLAVRAVDTTVVVEREGSVPASGFIAGRVLVPMEPGRYASRVAVQYGEALGAMAARAAVVVPQAAPTSLELSDLAVAGSDPPVAWPVTGGAAEGRVGFDPGLVFERTDTLAVFAEVSGARGRSAGRARALIRPVGGPTDRETRWRGFPGSSDWVGVAVKGSGRASVRLALPLRRLERGAYELELVVVDGSGATARQRSRFEVEDRRP
jgi:GWxTD domain-containing protein